MKSQRFNSIAFNITIIVLLASSIAVAIFATAITALNRRSAIHELDGHLATLADIVGQNSTASLSFNDKESANEVLQAVRQEPQINSVCLYDLTNLIFAEYRRSEQVLPCSKIRPNAFTTGSEERIAVRQVFRRDELLGVISVRSDLNDLHQRETHLLKLAVIMALIALISGGIAGAILQRRISAPLSMLVRAIDMVAAGHTAEAKVSISGSAEIAKLASGFNTMTAELAARDEMTKKAEHKLRRQARTDALTGLPNRRYFKERLTRAIAHAQSEDAVLALLFIDLDGFKLVNDSLGHAVGDVLLCSVAKRLRIKTRSSDFLARVGGDEFTILLCSLACAEDAENIARTLLKSLSTVFRIENHEITIGASIGISVMSDNIADPTDLLRQADSAMYAAKRSGRNRVMYFSPELSLLARERLNIENQLRGAIERKEIYVHYQPEIDLKTGRITRFEALARWQHPNLGNVSPAQFIPVAEESGLIHPLGSFVMLQACREAVIWQKLVSYPVQVAVNVSVIQFNTETIVEEVAEILRQTGLNPNCLQIELTESVMVGSMRLSIEKMKSLQSLGVHLAIDDFGTGYSSLSYLPDLPVNAIKIDRSFLRNLDHGSDAAEMIRSIIGMAHTMHMLTIVEGVETETQLNLIKELGADEVQGFYFGRPSSNPQGVLMENNYDDA